MVESKNKTHMRTSINTTPLNITIANQSNNKISRNIYENQNPEIYNSTIVAGNGTFGVVYQSTIPETGERVAIKKVLQDSRYKNRELDIVKTLSHPNIVALRHSFFSPGSKPNEVFLNLVMEYVPDTLYKIVRDYRKTNECLPLHLIKFYSFQILRSLEYCHNLGICHRDIKPQNLLVNPTDHRLALCDFGSAKILIRGEPNIAYICSRYYRAPELCLGATEYTTTVDIWSAGCVIAEMFIGQPIFAGEDANDQIIEIIKVLGTPNKETMIEMNRKYSGARLPEMRGTTLSRVFKGKIPTEAVNFLERLLVYSPSRRASASQLLQHSFFDDVRRIPNGANLPEHFNRSEQERKQI